MITQKSKKMAKQQNNLIYSAYYKSTVYTLQLSHCQVQSKNSNIEVEV